jgi:hypothetical protein
MRAEKTIITQARQVAVTVKGGIFSAGTSLLKPQDGQVRGTFFADMGNLRYRRVANEGGTFFDSP